ncbi:MAG TPA: hypothetical protein VGE62_02110 [Candidatus Paceibacterota bacterium]
MSPFGSWRSSEKKGVLVPEKGTTLLEMLLYVALFSICFSTMGQVVLSAQKVAEKISVERAYRLADAYAIEYAHALSRASGDFPTADEISEFLSRIAPRMDIPYSAESGVTVEIEEGRAQAIYVDEIHARRSALIRYTIGNSQRSLRVYLL